MIRVVKILMFVMTMFIIACEKEDPVNPVEIIELSGEVTTDMILEDLFEGPGADYYVTGKWGLRANVKIMPGVNIMMKSGASIIVYNEGSLDATGIETNPILIYGEQNSKGYWAEITFDNSNQSKNRFEYVLITDGGGGYGEGMINFKGNSQSTINHSVFGNSKRYGIYLTNVDSKLPGFTRNVISDCSEYPLKLHTGQLHFIDSTTYFLNNGSNNYVEVDGGDLTENVKWNSLTIPALLNSPYHTISADLTIEPGAVFVMGPGAKLNVEPEGSLKMIGTSEERIIFTGKVESPGYFEGIAYEDSNNPLNELQYVDISYGGSAYIDANLRVSGSTPLKMGNCNINHSAKWGVYVSRYSTFTDLGGNTFVENADVDIYIQE